MVVFLVFVLFLGLVMLIEPAMFAAWQNRLNRVWPGPTPFPDLLPQAHGQIRFLGAVLALLSTLALFALAGSVSSRSLVGRASARAGLQSRCVVNQFCDRQ